MVSITRTMVSYAGMSADVALRRGRLLDDGHDDALLELGDAGPVVVPQPEQVRVEWIGVPARTAAVPIA
jgi:hypothetical protein